jgi:hypothetical protein
LSKTNVQAKKHWRCAEAQKTFESHASGEFIILCAKTPRETIEYGEVPNRHVKRNPNISFDMPEIVTWYCYIED